MPEPSDHSLSRRGAWIGLRTLHQRPKVVDHTETGDPIFEVRSVRLVLRPEADHFNRLESCSKCGQKVPGAPIHELADLDRPSNPLVCTRCVRAVAAPTQLRPDLRRAQPEPPPAPLPAPEDVAPAPAADTGPGEGTDAGEPAVRSVADDVQEQLGVLTEVLRAQQRELAASAAALAETRAELRAVTDSHRELARTQHDADQRLVDMAERLSRQSPGAGRTEALERRMEEVVAVLTQGLAQARAEAADSVAQLRDNMVALARMVASERPDDEIAARLQLLERRLEELTGRLGALTQAPASRGSPPARDLLDTLEQQLQAAEGRLSQL